MLINRDVLFPVGWEMVGVNNWGCVVPSWQGDFIFHDCPDEGALAPLCQFTQRKTEGNYLLPPLTKEFLVHRLDPNYGLSQRVAVETLLHIPASRWLFLMLVKLIPSRDLTRSNIVLPHLCIAVDYTGNGKTCLCIIIKLHFTSQLLKSKSMLTCSQHSLTGLFKCAHTHYEIIERYQLGKSSTLFDIWHVVAYCESPQMFALIDRVQQ